MKSLLLAISVTLSATAAFADHSLSLAMNDSPALRNAVEALTTKKKVVCDLDHSLQMAGTSKAGELAMRQVAFCFASVKAMQENLETLTHGNELGGIYGLPVTAILDVTYTFENYSAGDVVSATLK